ncbi:MAG TPA: hypothetical protein VFI78_03895, partial [Salinimicrobium sp.]|nr:hypothetical protein [Salinimicrobium sp.]
KKISNKKLAVIINEKELVPTDLEDLLEPCLGIITMIRIAVSPKNIVPALKLAEKIKKMGFEVGFNIMYMSTWNTNPDFFGEIKNLNGLVDYFYLVDSYGGVYPGEVKRLFETINSKIDIKTGFHAHNNLELGLINSLTAIDCSVDIIDSTITGMGRGAGNLKTELLLVALQSQNKLSVNYDELSTLVSQFGKLQEKYKWGTNLPYMVSGANSLPQQEVMTQLSQRYYSLNSIVHDVYQKTKVNQEDIDIKEFLPSNTYKNALIIGGGETGINYSEAIKTFLKLNPDTCLVHSSSKNAAAYKNLPQQQYHCLEGSEGHRLEKIYGDLERSEKIAILPPPPRIKGTVIPEALKTCAFQLKEISFTTTNTGSVTALAIQTALKLKVEKLYFVGYDGYEGNISPAETALFKENEGLFEILNEQNPSVCALTPTKYSELRQESVFALI